MSPVGDDQIPPQFSPDGRYWWDGEQWLPVDQLPKPLAEAPPGDDYGPPPNRRSPMVPVLAAGIAIVIVIAVLGVLITNGWLRLPGPSPAPTGAPTASPTPSPVYVPGMTLQTWTRLAEQGGLECFDLSEDVPDLAGFCQAKDNSVVRRIVVFGRTNRQIETVRIVYRDDTKTPDANAAATFLGRLAAVQYPGANPSQASNWVRTHPSGRTSIGGVTFRTHVEPKAHRWVLDVFPEGH